MESRQSFKEIMSRFGNAIWIMQYYGDFEQCKRILQQLCAASYLMFEQYDIEFEDNLTSGRRRLSNSTNVGNKLAFLLENKNYMKYVTNFEVKNKTNYEDLLTFFDELEQINYLERFLKHGCQKIFFLLSANTLRNYVDVYDKIGRYGTKSIIETKLLLHEAWFRLNIPIPFLSQYVPTYGCECNNFRELNFSDINKEKIKDLDLSIKHLNINLMNLNSDLLSERNKYTFQKSLESIEISAEIGQPKLHEISNSLFNLNLKFDKLKKIKIKYNVFDSNRFLEVTDCINNQQHWNLTFGAASKSDNILEASSKHSYVYCYTNGEPYLLHSELLKIAFEKKNNIQFVDNRIVMFKSPMFLDLTDVKIYRQKTIDTHSSKSRKQIDQHTHQFIFFKEYLEHGQLLGKSTDTFFVIMNSRWDELKIKNVFLKQTLNPDTRLLMLNITKPGTEIELKRLIIFISKISQKTKIYLNFSWDGSCNNHVLIGHLLSLRLVKVKIGVKLIVSSCKYLSFIYSLFDHKWVTDIEIPTHRLKINNMTQNTKKELRALLISSSYTKVINKAQILLNGNEKLENHHLSWP